MANFTFFLLASLSRLRPSLSRYLRGLLLLILLAMSQYGKSQGFNTTTVPWALPAGGYATTTHDYSYLSLSHTATSASVLDHTWATLDMNGDAKPDLVVLTEGNGSYNEPFGTGTARYWKVYLNTGNGYATTATTWALPAGGRIVTGSGRLASFDAIEYEGTAYTGNQGWTVKDMNGDSKPDLLVLTQGNGTYNEAPGLGSSHYWLVYMNTGAGFATTATTWALPAGGYTDSNGHMYGYTALVMDLNSVGGGQAWLVTDINGDSKPDIVVFTENSRVLGPNTNAGGRYWKVYLNTGVGFASAATTWALPPGGYIFDTGGVGSTTIYTSFNGSTHQESSSGRRIGNQEWALLDMNGDNRPDLAVATRLVPH